MQRDDFEYAGFWLRVWAAVIDGALIGIIVCPILIAIYGSAYFDTDRKSIAGPADLLLTWVFPAVAVILFWIKKQATPGKMAISARIVDAKTGNNASDGQLIGRYFAYFLSALPLGLGMIWIAFDERKQGWHDNLAGTVVIHPKVRGTQNVETASTIQRPAIISVNTAPQKEKQTLPEADSSEEDFYEQAFKELESTDRKVGLWAKVFAAASGNESLAKANYLTMRSGQLGNELKQTLLGDEHRRQLEEVRQRQEDETITEIESAPTFTSPTLGAEFILIPSGTFIMGSPVGEAGRGNDETQHQVTISKPFYMQTTPVTQGQWKKVMGNNPSYFSRCGDDVPVEQVSWNDAQIFIRNIKKLERTDKYRLPTEAQWEYAARAGTTTMFNTGDSEEDLSRAGWYSENSGFKTNQVSQKTPNAWSLYDMHGNVREWVQDWKGDYPTSGVTDPVGPASGSCRVIRGGSGVTDAVVCRAASRDDGDPDDRFDALGFRLLRTC